MSEITIESFLIEYEVWENVDLWYEKPPLGNYQTQVSKQNYLGRTLIQPF